MASPIGVSRTVSADFVSVSEAAVLLGVTRRHVENLIRRGELPAVRVGRAVRIPLAALRALPRIEPKAAA